MYVSLEEILKRRLTPPELEFAYQILYGRSKDESDIQVNGDLLKIAEKEDFELKYESFVHRAEKEQCRPRRSVRIALIQNQIIEKTTEPLRKQYESLRTRISKLIDVAAKSGANIVCLQEAWTMPFAFCTREKSVWTEFAENAETGETTKFLKKKAKQYNMVIISPILESDDSHQGVLYNTAVVIDNRGAYMGKHRKNHIPRTHCFNEATYYLEGNTGHPVFETDFGRLAINICYGRHHPLNWMAFAMNGAEIVFNPCATVDKLSEHLWHIEARNAAIANNYYVASINRVGTETFPNPFTTGCGAPPQCDFGPFFGSSYVTCPDGSRSESLSRNRDGILVAEVDLNLIRQVRNKWMIQATGRYEMYAQFLQNYVKHDFKPQIIKSRHRIIDEEEEQEDEEDIGKLNHVNRIE